MRGRARVPGGGPLDLEGVVREIADTVRRYGLHTVIGDRYAGHWVREAFSRAGLRYEEATLRKDGEPVPLDKASAYLEVEPLFAQGRIELLDHPQLLRELKLLERRPRVGGKTLVDHPHGGHDDYANALALAAAKTWQGRLAPWAGALDVLSPAGATRVPAHIAQIGEPSRTAGVGWTGARSGVAPAAGQLSGQAAAIRRRYP